MLTVPKIGKKYLSKIASIHLWFWYICIKKKETYIVYWCYFRIMILRGMSLNLHDCPFGVLNLFLVAFMSAFLSCLHCYISEMLWILYSMNWTWYNMMWSNTSYYGWTHARCFLYLHIFPPTIEMAALI